MATVKTEKKDCEEETLQTAFKKLRVDAESAVAAVRVGETITSRAAEGAKPKISSPKENWHGCIRKSSRGLARSQRRRRSKSPILQSPKFTYCSTKTQLKHKSHTEPEDTSNSPLVPAEKELLPSAAHSPVFGAAGYGSSLSLEKSKISSQLHNTTLLGKESTATREGKNTGEPPDTTRAPATDFKSLCQHQENDACPCDHNECQCESWQGVEVYSFTGLREVISECESKNSSSTDASQNSKAGSATSTSNSPRSCSEQARAYVDDVTIEDLSGYMEYYLYIPKKMSHMAEMMYT